MRTTVKVFDFRSSCASSNSASRFVAALYRIALALALCAAAGCATTGPPAVGSRGWHEQRITEIESAYSRGDLTTEQYLSLKNEADATRAEYSAALRRASYPPPLYPYPFFIHHHHH